MMEELKNIYLKFVASIREKRLKRQKALIQMMMMSGCVRRVK